jgi:hypothetical protein
MMALAAVKNKLMAHGLQVRLHLLPAVTSARCKMWPIMLNLLSHVVVHMHCCGLPFTGGCLLQCCPVTEGPECTNCQDSMSCTSY